MELSGIGTSSIGKRHNGRQGNQSETSPLSAIVHCENGHGPALSEGHLSEVMHASASVRFCVYAFIVVFFGGWLAAYYAAYLTKQLYRDCFYLSFVANKDPMRAIISVCMPLSGLFLIPVWAGRRTWLRSRLRPKLNGSLQWLLPKLFWWYDAFSIASILSLFGVGGVSLDTNIYIHLIFAFGVFIGAAGHNVFHSLLEWKFVLPSRATSIRVMLQVVALISSLILAGCFAFFHYLGSIMEVVASMSIMVYILTFAWDSDEVCELRAWAESRI